MIQLKHCINCNSQNIEATTGEFIAKIKNKKIRIPNIDYYICHNCLERFTDLENERKIDEFFKNKTRPLSKSHLQKASNF